MRNNDEYLNPVCLPKTLDTWVMRRALLGAVRDALPSFSGTVLDIGCGHMPYKPLLLAPPSRAEKYIGLDLPDNGYTRPDVEWDGLTIPFRDASVDCAIATEVFEHCPEPELVMREVLRVLKPGGRLFFTVPFLWPIHCAPHDEYRYTPFSLRRHLENAGFQDVELRALGGWHASFAQMIGLWTRCSPIAAWKSSILSLIAFPLVRLLFWWDEPPHDLSKNGMITGLCGFAEKPAG